MYVSEFQRHEVFKWLEEQMGPERASIMMDLLPPVGWGDVVTTRDLHAEVGGLRSEMQAGFAELRAEMHAAHSGLLVKLFFGMVASNATLVGLVLTATRLS
ncbi:hypothetical protein NHL50_02020 [Acidimicrobiia bacterium EGI L10123]|uniref:hypothetical protein n=1 Tax=Salinilacustrithrix flava TaxID=2957203 RepID=UPI003D7C1DB6|nr:hypothetical protein [Acidimicrobiia bacterium EGI L10123]